MITQPTETIDGQIEVIGEIKDSIYITDSELK